MASEHDDPNKGLIAWFANNRVAANLLMVVLILAGVYSAVTMRKQTTPDFELNRISIRVPYLGAAPEEVEEGVVLKIEEAVQDIIGIAEINGTASEGVGSVTVGLTQDADVDLLLSEIKTRVDAIDTFPVQAEQPVIYKETIPIPVLFVALYGDLDELARKALAEKLRNELMTLPEVNQVEILGDRDFEISIEVSENTLREYNLSLSDVSNAINAAAIDLPGGTIKADSGNIQLRTTGQVYTGIDFADLTLRTFPDGTRLTIGDIATINDGFVENSGFNRFNRRSTATLRILAGAQQNELATSEVVKNFIEEQRAALPSGVTMDLWVDRAHYLRDRLNMMLKNMAQGAVLVFVVLTLFLRWKVAFWVIVGIPITFFGALTFMPLNPWPVTINVISLFAFILVLGIVVDDAIIIGESVYTKIRSDGHSVENVVRGTRRVATAATFGVLTTIAAFVPLLFVGGDFAAPFLQAIAVVVSLCLLFSLVESKLILPAHLAHAKIKPVDADFVARPYRHTPVLRWPSKALHRLQNRVQSSLQWFIDRVYQPSLGVAIRFRWLTIVTFFSCLIVTFGLLQSKFIRVVVFPEVPGDYVQVNIEMNAGTPSARRDAAVLQVEDALYSAMDNYLKDNPGAIEPVRYVAAFSNGDARGTLIAELPIDESRPFDNQDVTEMWRNALPQISGLKEITFTDGNNLGGGAPVSIGLSGTDNEQLAAAADELVARVAQFEGLFDVRSDQSDGAEEIRLSIKPEAEALGVTLASLGRQVRQAFYGEEAQRIQRGRDDIRVMVRYPEDERRSVADLQNMRIRTPGGDQVPFESVASVEYDKAYSRIRRYNRVRTVSVSADADRAVAEPGKIVEELYKEYIPGLEARYPSVTARRQGSSEEEQEILRSFVVAGIAALFLIYALIAIPLKSYTQPAIIMSVIPFGLIGAVIGHIVTGNAISMFSMFGLIALAGVVVNDSLIMMDFINKARLDGVDAHTAVVQSGTARFRAIILTSLTTAFGLMPIIFEKSVQAQFVIPMAVSLSFGILFATVITLFLIPALYMARLDVGWAAQSFWRLLVGNRQLDPRPQ
ncbi:MAG: efflux RND transporter permease subunit [Pseudomonadota bacterium]